MQSISTKIRWIVGVLALNMITIIFVDIRLNIDQKNDAKVINTAGKQRMLSQRTVLELHRLLLGEAEAYEKLEQSRSQFDQNFKELKLLAPDYRSSSHHDVEDTLLQVSNHWNRMSEMIDRYLQGDHNLYDLKKIYDDGDQTLILMDKAVSQYEEYMMEKHLIAYRIQIALAIISVLIILYMARIALSIQHNFNSFLEHSKTISGQQVVAVDSKNELDIACAHIEYFLHNVEEALQSATEAVEKSEEATASLLLGSAPEAEALLEQNEDVMIQIGEELHQTAERLKKLKSNLQKATSLSNLQI